MSYKAQYTIETFRKEARPFLAVIEKSTDLESARSKLIELTMRFLSKMQYEKQQSSAQQLIRTRDCAFALLSVFSRRSDVLTGFSVTRVFWDIAQKKERNDVSAAFFAEIINWIRGLKGIARFVYIPVSDYDVTLVGRAAAVERSDYLDKISDYMCQKLLTYSDGLYSVSQERRQKRKQHVMSVLQAGPEQWNDWQWHTRNIITNAEILKQLIDIDSQTLAVIEELSTWKLPFGVTPYYVSLMDKQEEGRDRTIRAQVIPPRDYVEIMSAHHHDKSYSCDFMLENDTSPIELITRRYPGIVILKPYNACPQICVYCQRNWEIDQPMAPGAYAGRDKIRKACQWIKTHKHIREILVTGGDPFVMPDCEIEWLLTELAQIDHVDIIRFGTRTLVTLPMRITNDLVSILGRFRELGRRDIAVVTHIEHPYEITIDTASAVDRLKRQGISVYNQLVYSFYVSRRFEATALRLLLRRIGIDPYYTFVPKGKEETRQYRVPIARLLQEQKEESRLVPGLRRMDEAVYNIPGLGKNNIRAKQHRDLLSLAPDGSRLYEFHPWEKNVVSCSTYIMKDVPILDYLERLESIGENSNDYDSIWFYF